jgi:nucleotide-binding universal stress UspA family protein
MTDSQVALICYDGSDAARRAIAKAGELLAPSRAVVATAWQPVSIALSSHSLGAPAVFPHDRDLDREVEESALRTARAGSELAREAGFDAEAVDVEADGPIWQAICEAAAKHDAAVVVAGTRGLRGIKSAMLGSVSSGILHHVHRPVLIVSPEEP